MFAKHRLWRSLIFNFLFIFHAGQEDFYDYKMTETRSTNAEWKLEWSMENEMKKKRIIDLINILMYKKYVRFLLFPIIITYITSYIWTCIECSNWEEKKFCSNDEMTTSEVDSLIEESDVLGELSSE